MSTMLSNTIHCVITGLKQLELEAQALSSEDDEVYGTDKPPSQIKPDRNQDSTIHTARQFLVDTAAQVKFTLCSSSQN